MFTTYLVCLWNNIIWVLSHLVWHPDKHRTVLLWRIQTQFVISILSLQDSWLKYKLYATKQLQFKTLHSLNTNYYGITFDGVPRSFNSSQINVCLLGIGELGPWFLVSSKGLGLHKILPRGDSSPAPPACQAITRPCLPPLLPVFYFDCCSINF